MNQLTLTCHLPRLSLRGKLFPDPLTSQDQLAQLRFLVLFDLGGVALWLIRSCGDGLESGAAVFLPLEPGGSRF